MEEDILCECAEACISEEPTAVWKLLLLAWLFLT